MPKKNKKGKNEVVAQAPKIVLQDELCGTLDKFCGNGFKPRYFKLTHGLLRYYREEPKAGNPDEECIRIGYIVDLLTGFDHMGLMEDAKREFQFTYQEHVFRLRARTEEIKNAWLTHLQQRLRNLHYEDMIHSSFLIEVAAIKKYGRDITHSNKVFAYVQEGNMVVSKADTDVVSFDFPAVATVKAEMSQRASFEPVEGGLVKMKGKDKIWNVLQVGAGRAQIQMVDSQMKKWAEFDQLESNEPEPEPPMAAPQGSPQAAMELKVQLAHETMAAAPQMILMSQLIDLQNGFDMDAEALSDDPKLEFQFIFKVEPRRFRVEDIDTQRKWMHELQQEVAAAVDLQDDAVAIIYKQLEPALASLPVKDEDIHYILFFQKKDALALQGAEAEAAALEKASFGIDSLGDAALTAGYTEDMSPVAEWLHSLGIRKYEEYAKLMEDEHELEVEDLQYLTEANLEEVGITAVGPRNRIMRAVSFMANRDRDPTIDESGNTVHIQFQFYIPYRFSAYSESIPLEWTVSQLKSKLVMDMVRFEVEEKKKKMPSDEQLEAMTTRHRLTIVPGLGRWDESTQMSDESVRLREVPFIFSCFTNDITPRINLEEIGIADTKQGILQTIIDCGVESPAEQLVGDGGEFAKFLQSDQMKQLRKMMAGIDYMATADSLFSKREMLKKHTLVARCDSHMTLPVGMLADFKVQVYPIQKSRYECLTVSCNAETTVKEVMATFIADYEDGRWAKVLNPRKLAGATIKRWHFAEILFDEDRLCEYDFVKRDLSEHNPVKLTLDFMPMMERIRSQPIPEVLPLPRELVLTVEEMAWMSRITRTRLGLSEDENELGEGDDINSSTMSESLASKMKQSSEHLAELMRNPLSDLSEQEKVVMWSFRNEPGIRRSPRMLAKVLMSVPDWENPLVVNEAYELVAQHSGKCWCILSPAEALQLLDPLFWENVLMVGTKRAKKCKNPKKTFRPFREYAVRCLSDITDTQLMDYMLQFTQTMKQETISESALAKFLMYRALRNPYLVGQTMYWQLRAEMSGGDPHKEIHGTASVIDIDEVNRLFAHFGIFLRQYLDRAGEQRGELLMQEDFVQQLRKVAINVINSPDAERLSVLRNDLRHVKLPKTGVRLPVNPNQRVTAVVPDRCRYMDSAKKPLWIELTNVDPSGEAILVIFKDGDDVRQDQLVLQMFKLMQEVRLACRHFAQCFLYNCLAKKQ
jgi:hypothetical protein